MAVAIEATTTKLMAVPWPVSLRNAIPTTTVATHTASLATQFACGDSGLLSASQKLTFTEPSCPLNTP